MFLPELPLFEKSGLIAFQNNLLSLTKDGFSLLKFFLHFLFFLHALKDLSLLFKKINIFQVGPSPYTI